MQTMYRLFVKRPVDQVQRDHNGVKQDIVKSVDVGAAEVYQTMRDLEKEFPGHRISSKMLDPLAG